MKKAYLDYVPSEEEILFFGWEKDENGYYNEEPDELPDNAKGWADYWSQFSNGEIVKMMF